MKRWIIWHITKQRNLWFVGKSGNFSTRPFMYETLEDAEKDYEYFQKINPNAVWYLKELEFS